MSTHVYIDDWVAVITGAVASQGIEMHQPDDLGACRR